MNEFIEIQLKKNGRRLKVRRQLTNGIELDESDPIERTVGIQFTPQDRVTEIRVDSIRRMQGWDPGQFKLKVGVEDGSIILRGVDQDALPEGRYGLRLHVEEAKSPGKVIADVAHDGGATVVVDVTMDDRSVDVDLDDMDDDIKALLERSAIEGIQADDWVQDDDHRPTRRACLLNLVASLRVRPSMGSSLLGLIDSVYAAANDRIYAKVDRAMLPTLEALVKDDAKPFFREGTPHAPIHRVLLDEMPEPVAVKTQFQDLISFRAEGRPSMQIVIAEPAPALTHTYADLDLDLANPLQNLTGFIVHMGELLDGKPTNHLDLRKDLAKTKAGDFLYYTVVA